MSARETSEPSPLSTENESTWGKYRSFVLSVILFTVPLGLFSIVQYFRYGFGLFLGWDTSTYVWSANQFSLGPLQYFARVSYPSLYVVLLAGLGGLSGQTSIAERVLPFLVAVPLGFAYYRLTLEITSDRRLGYLAALLGGIAINTLRLESDLNRNLLSFSVSMLLGVMVSTDLKNPSFSWKNQWKRLLVTWLPLFAIVAYTEIETYLVLALSLLLMFYVASGIKTTAVGALLLSIPVVVSLPLIWPFLSGYAAGIGLVIVAQPAPVSILAASALYLGGFALPWTILGLVIVYRSARKRTGAALFVVSWLASLVILLPIALGLGLPFDRFLYVVPIPVIVATGARSFLFKGSSLAKWNYFRRFLARSAPKALMKYIFPIGLVLLVCLTLVTSISTTDAFLRPYVSQADTTRLSQAAAILRQDGYTQPVLVMYGPTAADLNPLYRAYFGVDLPNSFAYYGKLQYLFTLPNPTNVYTWQYDPPFEQASSLRYRTEMLSQLGDSPNILSRPIIIAGGDTYARPLSEAFLSQFETVPGSGTYIIPPNALQPAQADSWRLFAYSDWRATTSATAANASWSQAGQDLTYASKSPGAHFEANYTISLLQSWSTMEFTLSLYDWQQPFVFPDATNATLAPLNVLFDNQVIISHIYNGLGATTIKTSLRPVSSGVHTITITSGAAGTNTAVAVALGDIRVCPVSCS